MVRGDHDDQLVVVGRGGEDFGLVMRYDAAPELLLQGGWPSAPRANVATMTDRLQFHEALPETYKRLLNLNAHVGRMAEEHSVPTRLIELVKIRCSQINGCAFCADLHASRALEAGEDHRRLAVLATWREAGTLYDERERAALDLAEAVSHLASTQEVSDAVYDRAAALFTPDELAVITWEIAVIQAFNALNVTARKPLPQ